MSKIKFYEVVPVPPGKSDATPDGIGDAGETIPYAHKHRARARGPDRQGGVSLADLWPEPDWVEMIAQGRPIDVAARLAAIYSGLANRPKSETSYASSADWRTAFQESVCLIRSLFERARTMEDVKRLNEDLAKSCGTTAHEVAKLGTQDRRSQLFFALGRGTRRIQSPFNLTLRQAELARWLPELGWPENRRAFDVAIVPVEMTDNTWSVARIDGQGYQLLVQNLATRNEALETAIDYIAKSDNKVGASRAARAIQAERIGPDYREGRDISPEDLMKIFGFRGVQFGESLSQTERQVWMNELHDALLDLAGLLGLKPQWIGLKGLALAVGARGMGSALAHYEPELRCFNYTRKRGAGSVAHEWWHALDGYLIQWVAPHYFKQPGGYLSRYQSRFEEATHPSAPAVLPALSTVLSFTHGNQPSRFLRDAWKIAAMPRQGEYWYRRHELAARAFEAYVQDGLAKDGRISPYLVLGTSEQEMMEEDSDLRAYPIGDERLAINRAFQGIFAGLSGSTVTPAPVAA